MFSVSIEFLHGVFRADPDGTAITGSQTQGEWPPSPARLFAAFVAADGTGAACRVTDGTELEWLERLPSPIIHAEPEPVHQPLRLRFVVRHVSPSGGAHQEYVGRSGAPSHPGARVALHDPQVVYLWEVDQPADAILGAVRRRAARVGYLGAADSPVRVRVKAGIFPSPAGAGAFVPDQEGDKVINVTEAGDLARWDRLHERWTERGPSVPRSRAPALMHPRLYRSPLSGGPRKVPEVVAWLRLEAAVPGRRVSAVTALFKEAVLSQYQRLHGEPPAILHGHGVGGTGYEIARYLALPDIGFRWSRGRIHGLALWLPEGCDSKVRSMCRDAAFNIRRLTGRGIDVAVARREDEDHPVAAHPRRWCQPSRSWATAIPAIHERRLPLDLAEVSRWCRHAGLPDPIAFRSARTPLVQGALDLAPVEVNRPNRPALPYSHVELLFGRAIPGPVVVGSGRQRGFGLCVPTEHRLDRRMSPR